MKRRRVVVGLGVLALVGVAAYVVWPRGPQPCRETFERVRDGMTYEEVCATVGGPSRDRLNGPMTAGSGDSVTYAGADVWWAGDAGLAVYYDGSGQAARVQVFEVAHPSAWSRLRDWLGL
jgi:hypothetical protein